MFSTIDVGEWSWTTFTVTILLLHFKYNLGLYACNTTYTGNDPPDVHLWWFTANLSRTRDRNRHQTVRAFPNLRSGYDFGLQCQWVRPSCYRHIQRCARKLKPTSAHRPPSWSFARKTLHAPPSESELQDYRITSLTKCPLLIWNLNSTLGYPFPWILYVGHFQLCPDPDVDKD